MDQNNSKPSSSKMCKTFSIPEDDILIMGGYNKPTLKTELLTAPNTPRLRSNTISYHAPMDTSAPKSVEEAYGEIINNLNNMEDPDDFFGLKISELIDIEEAQEAQTHVRKLALPEFLLKSPKSEEEIIIEEPKKKTDLQKLCGFQSYQHVIEKAIYSSEEKMLTLNQIYTWIEENIPYFHDLSRASKSKCWKNAIRHNLSLHKQFYKVLREGHRSCLWAVDKSRIRKGEKTKKPTPILPASFRPRSQTDPISMKPVKNFIAERIAANQANNQKNIDSLISHMASVESSGLASMETLPQDPVVYDRFNSSPSSSSSAGTPWMSSQNSPNSQNVGYVPSVTPWNFESQSSSDYTPNFDSLAMSSPQSMELELNVDAIIEHEKHLYDDNNSYTPY